MQLEWLSIYYYMVHYTRLSAQSAVTKTSQKRHVSSPVLNADSARH
jgi:hypothetical protein